MLCSAHARSSRAFSWCTRLVVAPVLLALAATLAGCSDSSQSSEPPASGDAKQQQSSQMSERKVAQSSRSDESSEKSEEPSKASKAPSAAPTAPNGPANCPDGTSRRTNLITGSQKQGEVRGTVVEASGASYELQASLTDDGCTPAGTVEYVDIGCSGTWTAQSVEEVAAGSGLQPGVRVDFAELITDDPKDLCATETQLTLLRDSTGLSFSSSWVRWNGETSTSSAQLDLGN